MKNLCKFLEESNKIEGVYDKDSLEQAKLSWEHCIKQDKLTLSAILKTHAILMKNQNIRKNQKGKLRTQGVFVGNRLCPHYSDVPRLIDYWIANLEQSKSQKDFKIDHINYENIHPFIDGNGRTGRIFMNWQRIKVGLPLLVIKESEKQKYYKWFN